ncbi:MAG TPA: MFS transporter [Actinomycetota bacterium]
MSEAGPTVATESPRSIDAFKAILRSPNLRRLQLAWMGSNLGTWGYGVALAVFAFNEGGAAAVGVVALLRLIPAAIATPFTSTLGDRYPRRAVMAISDLIRVVLLVLAGFLVLADVPAGWIYALASIGVIVSTAFRPAQAALIPSLATTPQELTASNVVSSTIESLGMFVGPAIGAAILAFSGPAAVFFLAAATFLWSAALVWQIRVPTEADDQEEAAAAEERPPFLRQTFEGFVFVAKTPGPRLLVGMFGLQTLVAGAFIVFEVVIALDLLGKGDSWVGVIASAFGVGGLLGAVVSGALVGKNRLALNFGAGILLWGGPLVFVGLWPNEVVVIASMLIMGLGNTVVDVAGLTLLQRAVPDEMIARVFGVLESTFLATVAIGAAVTPWVVETLGATTSLIVVGAFLPVMIVLLWGKLQKLDRSVQPATEEIAFLRGISFFSPLAPPIVEHLAGRLTSYTVPAGAHVFEQGDSGDRFYVVAEGRVDILKDGQVVAQVGPGGYFGEIALLHDVPRQAGAVAGPDTRLLSLDGEDFVAAVTGHAGSAEAAEAVIRSYGPTAGLPL